MSAKDLKAELRALRKETMKPISKMRKGDIAAEIEKLKVGREETPAVASVPSGSIKKSMSAVESIKEAKRMEFPQKPSMTMKSSKKSTTDAGHGVAAKEGKKKSSKLEKLLAMMDSSDDE